MAGIHAGALKEYDCDMCARTPALRENWGCITEAKRPKIDERQEEGIRYRYLTCPLKFVPNNVVELMRLLSYHNRFSSAPMPSYKNVSARFVLAVRFYDSELSRYIKPKG
jgi:hypothetical protein